MPFSHRCLPPTASLLVFAGLSLACAVAVPRGADGEDAAAVAEHERVNEVIRWNNLGIAHLARFRELEAVEAFRAALAIDPEYAVGWINLGIAHLSASEYEAAEEELRRGLTLAPGQRYARYNLGLVYKVQGRSAEAIEMFEAVHAVDADDPDTLYQLASLYARERRWDDAITTFRRSIEYGPDNISAYYGLGKALVQSGDPDEGKRYLELSQKMKAESPMHTTVGLRYGEQGKYSYAAEDDRVRQLARVSAPAPIEVKFVPVPAEKSGIDFVHLVAPKCGGSGAAMVDVDADGDLDLYLVQCALEEPDRLYRNDGKLRFTDITADAGLPRNGHGMAAAFGDYDNDGLPDLYRTGEAVSALYRNLGAGKFQEVTAAARIGAEGWSAGAAWADVDHDGDLDLYVVRQAGGPNRMFRNNGDGTFQEVAAAMRMEGKGTGFSLVFSDLDNDRDIDLVLPGRVGPWQILSNDRVGTFTDVAAEMGAEGLHVLGIAAGDVNKDGYMDLAATHATETEEGLSLYLNREGARLERADVPWEHGHASGLVFLDFDNDSYLDLAAIPSGEDSPAVVLLRNVGRGEWEDWTERTGLSSIPAGERSALLAGDLDDDGDLDLLVARRGAAPLLLRNDGGSRRNSLTVDPRGKGSNRSGVGTKVEVKAGRLWQKMEVTSASGYLSSGPTRVHFGLADQKRADALRLLWPSGVLQDEIDVASGSAGQVEELDRKGSSCPILYAWNGDTMAFVTDFLGGSAVGYRVGADRFNVPDTDEYVKVRGDQLMARDGVLDLRMVNQLEEVIFIDRAELLAVDHPAGFEVYPNERLLPGPPFPSFEVFAVAEERVPVSAVDEEGTDVRDSILQVDRRWPDTFELLPFKGYAEEHTLILDPGDLGDGDRVVLLMDAWIDYADSTSNLAASQAGEALLPPRLEVLDADGSWVTALSQMGFPAGLPKTLTVELTDLFLRDDDFRVRIVTNMRIYWDRVRFGILERSAPVRLSRLEAAAADVHFHGYPRRVSADGRAPFGYDYGDVARSAGWKEFEGAFTRYGDVRGLLTAVDDRYVILRHGDEIALSFDAAPLPELPAGWVRDYLVFADGFGKDMDLNSAAPHRVEPLPFHAMRRYPPADTVSADADRLEWILEMNTRRQQDPLPPLP